MVLLLRWIIGGNEKIPTFVSFGQRSVVLRHSTRVSYLGILTERRILWILHSHLKGVRHVKKIFGPHQKFTVQRVLVFYGLLCCGRRKQTEKDRVSEHYP